MIAMVDRKTGIGYMSTMVYRGGIWTWMWWVGCWRWILMNWRMMKESWSLAWVMVEGIWVVERGWSK